MFCAKGGVEPQSENVWRQADTYNVPRMAFINKMDILGANFYGAVDQIKTRLGKNAICIQLPIGKEDDFKGIIDLFEMKAYIYNDDKGDDISIIDIPEDMQDDAELPGCECGPFGFVSYGPAATIYKGVFPGGPEAFGQGQRPCGQAV